MANILEYLDTTGKIGIFAGGPGSGRKPEGGSKPSTSEAKPGPGHSDAKAAVEAHLKSLGFEKQPSHESATDTYWSKHEKVANADEGEGKKNSRLSTPIHSGVRHFVAVHPDGSWDHTSEGMHSGGGLDSLRSLAITAMGGTVTHGKGIKMLDAILAGGPGSGRKAGNAKDLSDDAKRTLTTIKEARSQDPDADHESIVQDSAAAFGHDPEKLHEAVLKEAKKQNYEI